MSELVRLSFSIEISLYDQLEGLVKENRYSNRSEYIRDMIRDKLVEREWERNQEALGTVTLVYDHHTRGLNEKLNDLQHEYHGAVLFTTHVHLDKHTCAEVIMIRGKAGRIRQIADLLRQQKGVLHAAINMSSTGKRLE